ncbi:hypothetical protein LXL04_010241 [Taraxacum kok-saghyz]
MPINSGRKMAWCSHCGRICNTSHDYPTNNTSCVECGKILSEENIVTNEFIYSDRSFHATRHNKRRETIWCPHCVRNGGTSYDHTTGIIECVDCGKVLLEDKNTNNANFFKDATRGRDKRLKRAQTTKKKSSSKTTCDVLNTTFGEKPITVKEGDETEDEYSKSDGHHLKSYDNEQESCSYDYNYDYDAGDESNGY